MLSPLEDRPGDETLLEEFLIPPQPGLGVVEEFLAGPLQFREVFLLFREVLLNQRVFPNDFGLPLAQGPESLLAERQRAGVSLTRSSSWISATISPA